MIRDGDDNDLPGINPVHQIEGKSMQRNAARLTLPSRKLDNAIIEIGHREGLSGSTRSFADYTVTAHRDRLPSGVELIEPGQ